MSALNLMTPVVTVSAVHVADAQVSGMAPVGVVIDMPGVAAPRVVMVTMALVPVLPVVSVNTNGVVVAVPAVKVEVKLPIDSARLPDGFDKPDQLAADGPSCSVHVPAPLQK